MRLLPSKYSLISLLIIISGAFATSGYAQGWRPINRRSGNRLAPRSSISHPTTPSVETSFYPTIRNTVPDFYAPVQPQPQSGWSDLGNGAKIRSARNFDSGAAGKDNRLSPEVLETIRQLKAEYAEPEPMYQISAPEKAMSANQNYSATSANKTPNGLIAPSSSKQGLQKNAVDIHSSTLTFPPGKNIRIKSLDFRQTDIADALRSLSRIINMNLMISEGVSGKTVTVLFNDVTMEEAFNTLLVNFNLAFAWEGKILRIFPQNAAPTFTRIYTVQHTNALEIQSMVQRLLSEKGRIELDTRTNSFIVTDTLAKLTEIENMLPKIDVQETGLEITSRPVTEVFYLNYADASTIMEPIKMLSEAVKIKEFSSSAASQAGAAGGGTSGRMDMMIITDTPTNLDRIRELIDKLDVPPIQVTIDAHIYEIDKNKEQQIGINWQKMIPVDGASGKNIFEATIAPSEPGGTGVFRFGSLDVNQFSAVLSLLNTNSFAKVLSNPVITTLNNRPANITVGQAISYISASTVSEGGQVSNTVSQAQANIALDVTPSVTGNDEVFLDIAPTISSVLGYTTLGGNSTPNLSNRTAKTQVICKNNHTIVIGGMIKTDKNESVNRVPFFGHLPGIGKLFQSKTIKETRTELIIFITPHIVREKAVRHNSSVLSATPRLSLDR